MSWWDTSNFSSLASQAFKNAQKKIDKVLDIEETEASKRKNSAQQKAAKSTKATKKEEETSEGGDFWSTWMGTGTKPESDESSATSAVPSSWNLPWGLASSDDKPKSHTSESSSVKDESEIPHQTSSTSEAVLEPSECSVTDIKEIDKGIEELEVEPCDEGSWVGGTNVNIGTETSAFVTSGGHDDISERRKVVNESESVDSVSMRLEVIEPELKAVDDSVTESEKGSDEMDLDLVVGEKEVVESIGVTSVSEGNSQEELLEFTKLTEDVEDCCKFDAQVMSVDSLGGWDISDSVMKLVETEEGPIDVLHNNDAMKSDVSTGDENRIFGNSFNETEEKCLKKESLPIETAQIGQDSFMREPVPVNSSSPISTLEEDTNVCDKVKFSMGVPFEEEIEIQHELRLEHEPERELSSIPLVEKERVEEVKDKENSVVAPTLVESNSQSRLIQDYVDISMMSKDSFVKEVNEVQEHSEFEVATEPSSSTGSSETGRLDSSADTVVDKSVQEFGRDERYSLFGDIVEKEDKDESLKSQSVIGDSVSPASSFVKCMLEDAMEESSKEDSGSDNHSNGSKSESSKLDSEFEKSGHSGQESSDDIETTTSSDIEIISNPGVDGNGKQMYSSFDLPQLKIAIQHRSSHGDRQGQHHFDSHSSSSTQSKCGDHEELSPERGEVHTWRDDEYQHSDLEAVQEEGADNPYHPERLLKKLAEMAEVLQARETKLVSMSKDNHQLVEDVNILRSQLKQSEEARESETSDLKALTDEFTIRIGESEKKLQAAIREKESLKQQLSFTQTELEKRSQNTDLEVLLEEKTEQVQELMKEGEKLSKQQLQSSNIIKKLRAKEKENDATLTSQKKKLEEQASELEKLKIVLDSKEIMESKQAEAINQLNSAVQKQDHDHAKVYSDLEDAQEKNRGLQTALDNAYKEIAELHRSNASQDSKAQEAALSKETSLREEMKMTLEREQQRFRKEKEAFIMQADDLRLDMARLEKEHSRREDLLREEIAHLQERLQQDEARSQDVSHSITAATRPLLRQIENLQATFGAQSTAWEKVEKNLTDRLAEAQLSLAMAQEKERAACDNEMELKAKVTTLESTNSRLKQDKSQLVAQREADKLQLEELQDSRNTFISQLEASKQCLSQELAQIKIDKIQLESSLALEINRLDNEKKKASALEEQLHLMERERPKSRGTPSPSPSMSVSRQESLMGSFYERNSPGFNLSFNQEDPLDASSDVRGMSKMSVYENLRQSGATVVVENLQSQLKLKEGEISHLQSEISQLERTRESMARELVNLSNQNDELQEKKKQYETMEKEFKELNNRYSAILLMYGEKEEQVQELRLDLQDVKEMYKSQIDALLAK